MLRCAITDDAFRKEDAARWAADGVEYIQLRAKTLEAGALAELGRSILHEIAAIGTAPTKLLINGRADVAVAIGAAGVHLTAREGELTPEQVRRVFAHAGLDKPLISVSCHTLAEVKQAKDNAADFVLFGPVFEKRIAGELVSEGLGLDQLRAACTLAGEMPMLALGGVTHENAPQCLAMGASGLAGIRTFAKPEP